MTVQLKEIGVRLKTLREDCEIEVDEAAKSLDVPIEEYMKYEAGELDFSFSFLYNAAEYFGVDIIDIMTGDSPHLTDCCMVRQGRGYKVDRYQTYDYRHLAYTFRNKKAEPFLVMQEPGSGVPVMHEHEGQEFNYVVKGKMKFYYDDVCYELNVGDSVYFDAEHPHAEEAVGDETVEFIAVVVK